MSRIVSCALMIVTVHAAFAAAYSVFDWMGAHTRVVVGEQASSAERDAALRICGILNPASPWAVAVTDEWVASHPKEAAAHHLIVVGTATSNRVLLDHPSMWWRTPEWRTPAAFAVRGLYLFGMGDLDGPSAGVVEPGRNPYAMADPEATEPAPETAITYMITCAGRHPEGVVAAVDALVEGRMLSGGIPDPRVLPRPEGPFELEPGMFEPPPPWVWDRGAAASPLGWHQADRIMVDAVTRRVGRPQGIWRIVLRHPSCPRDLRASLHRRNSEGEILLARMDTPQRAREAIRGLMRALGDVQEVVTGPRTVLKASTAEGEVWAGAAGAFWAVESVPGDGGRAELEALIGAAH